MAAIVGAMLLLNRQTAGMFENMLLFILPLPMVFYGTKYGLKDSWMLFAAIILLSFIVSTPQTLLLVAAESMIGMSYGCGVHNGTSTRTLVFRTVILAVITDIFTMLVFASFFGYDLVTEVTEYETLITEAMAQSGQTLSDTVDLTSLIRNILIVSTILTGVMEGLITHFLSRIVLKRMRFPAPKQISLSEYFPPKWTGYAGIAGMVAYFYSVSKPLENEIAQSFLQGGGMLGVFYLAFYGVIALMVIITLRNPRRKGMAVLLAVVSLLMFSPVMAVAGYLYITTDLHARVLEGVRNASQNR